MRNGPRNTETAPSEPTYVLPLNAYVALMHTRDELRLLSQLAEPRGEDDRDEIVLSTEALSDCFNRVAEQLGHILAHACRTDG